MTTPKVIVVLLRRPSKVPTERRDDPFWEVGSFGCTGCHKHNLMNPKRAYELEGARLAFVQGGPKGFRLVHLSPPIHIEPLGAGVEARWRPKAMPLSYQKAPLVIDNEGRTDMPLLVRETMGIARHTPVARFSSAFRSRRRPVAGEIGQQIIACYNRHRKPANIAPTYVEAMPYPPPLVELDREKRYRERRRLGMAEHFEASGCRR
jgi:hypothetical protein